MLLAIAVFMSSTLYGDQPQTHTLKITGDSEIFMLNELGAIMNEAEEGLEVLMVLPSAQLPEAYRQVDLRTGDVVMMFNGKRVNNVAEITGIYDKLSIGDEIKLGIKREKEMVIEKLKKADPSEMPKAMMVMKRPGEEGDINSAMLDAGFILKAENGRIMIDEVISELSDKYKGTTPSKGDVITTLQGNSLSQPEDLIQTYSGIEPGKKVEMTILRDGEELSISFIKETCAGAKPLIIKK
jgi:S1-C subfamily serine protease